MKYKAVLVLGAICVQMMASQSLFSKDTATGKEQGTVSFVDKSAQRQIDVMMDGKLFTSYLWPVDVFKPVLYPVITSAGTEVTRGYPLKPRA